MRQRDSGYLFFDHRGRTYRLRDEEILLRRDVSQLHGVGNHDPTRRIGGTSDTPNHCHHY